MELESFKSVKSSDTVELSMPFILSEELWSVKSEGWSDKSKLLKSVG